jgi:HAD superfamily hydrolase (TIGR01549 family)
MIHSEMMANTPHLARMAGVILQPLNHFRLFSRTFISRAPPPRAVCTFSSMAHSVRPRRFAPLDPAKQKEGDKRPKLKGIVFDVDGTLCEQYPWETCRLLTRTRPAAELHVRRDEVRASRIYCTTLDTPLISDRAALNIEKPTDILDHIYSLPEAEQEEAHEKIRNIERTAMKSQQPQAGLVELMDYLDSRGVQKGICTRNFDAPVEHLLSTFLPSSKFSPIITREFRPPKPDPAGILHIAKQWMHEDGGDSLIMVGDSIDDMTAGHRAGAATVLLVNDANKHLAEHEHTDLVVKQLDDLIDILEKGFEGNVDASS